MQMILFFIVVHHQHKNITVHCLFTVHLMLTNITFDFKNVLVKVEIM